MLDRERGLECQARRVVWGGRRVVMCGRGGMAAFHCRSVVVESRKSGFVWMERGGVLMPKGCVVKGRSGGM